MKWLVLGAVFTFAVFLLLLIITGEVWKAIAYATVALFGLLFALAIYFWGAMLFGGTLELLLRRRTPVPWTLGDADGPAVPEHDLDPGLELLAAGILVYRWGEVKPHVFFRQVPVGNMRAIRPFVVARTGLSNAFAFDFDLADAGNTVQMSETFETDLENTPQVVMPRHRLSIREPDALMDRRWHLQVRSGVTVVTSLRFSFVPGQQSNKLTSAGEEAASDQPVPDWLPRLLDDAIKREAISESQEIVLED